MNIHPQNIKIDFNSIKRISYLVAEFEIEDRGKWHKVEGRTEIKSEYHDVYMDLRQLLFDAAQNAIHNYKNYDAEVFIDVSIFDKPNSKKIVEQDELEQVQIDGAAFGTVVNQFGEELAKDEHKTAIKPENIYEKIDHLRRTE